MVIGCCVGLKCSCEYVKYVNRGNAKHEENLMFVDYINHNSTKPVKYDGKRNVCNRNRCIGGLKSSQLLSGKYLIDEHTVCLWLLYVCVSGSVI